MSKRPKTVFDCDLCAENNLSDKDQLPDGWVLLVFEDGCGGTYQKHVCKYCVGKICHNEATR